VRYPAVQVNYRFTGSSSGIRKAKCIIPNKGFVKGPGVPDFYLPDLPGEE